MGPSSPSTPRPTPLARPVAVVGSARIPFARSFGAYADETNRSLLAAALAALAGRFALRGEAVGEVVAGAVIKHPRDWNLAREAALDAGLAPETPASDVQRACATSLTAALHVAHRIARGEIDCGIAGGADSVSDLPLTLRRRLARIVATSARAPTLTRRLQPWLGLRPGDLRPEVPGVAEPRTGLSMGDHCERMAKEWAIPRVEQDQLALASHRRAHAAANAGFYAGLVTPHAGLARDDNVRPDGSLERLARLPPVFDRTKAGTITAANSSPLTDGASAVLLASDDWARGRGLAVQAWITHGAVAAVDFAGLAGPAEGLLMAPVHAIARVLDDAGLTLADLDVIEIHEAFAAQVLCNVAALASPAYARARLGRDEPLGVVDRERLNPNGSSIAVGHPFGATGARILGALAHDMARRDLKRGLVSICTAGGMGVVALLER